MVLTTETIKVIKTSQCLIRKLSKRDARSVSLASVNNNHIVQINSAYCLEGSFHN